MSENQPHIPPTDAVPPAQPANMPQSTEWSDPTFYRRDNFGASVEVNERWATNEMPQDPHFPHGGRYVPVDRLRYGLEPEVSVGSTPQSPEKQRITTVGQVAGRVALDAMSEQVATGPEKIQTRSELLFSAYKVPEQAKAAEPKNYDYLFNKEYDEPKSDPQEQQLGVVLSPQASPRGIVTEAGMKSSAEMLGPQMVDHNLRDIIFKHPAIAAHWNGIESVVNTLRTDSDLRIQVGEYLQSKLNQTHANALPGQLLRHAQKRTNQPGYEHIPELTSREYAVLLALAMLDGTFDPDKNTPTYDKRTESGDGEHRYTAKLLLGSESPRN